MAIEPGPPPATGRRKPVLCLIGGIGSGKSQVAAELARHGARVVAADPIGHEALRQPEVLEQVARRWGPEVLDEQGNVVRRKLGAVVFSNLEELRALEALVYPYIKRRLREEVEAALADPAVGLVVVDAAVLLEAGWNECCDRILYVHTPRALRYQRLAEQRGWSEKEVDARARAQLSLTDKVSRADFVVDNSGSLEQLRSQVEAVLEQLVMTAGAPQAGS